MEEKLKKSLENILEYMKDEKAAMLVIEKELEESAVLRKRIGKFSLM